MAIKNVLFDADGVIQDTTPDWMDHWKRMIPDPAEADGFVSDIFAAEYPHLLGKKGFEDSLKRVMRKWKIETPLSDVLHAWTLIKPSKPVLAMVSNVRANGTLVMLATNQQQFRYQHMIEKMRYDRYFDGFFVSCEMNVAKPSIGYFEKIIHRQRLQPAEFLFIDDSDRNVEAARQCGMNAVLYHLSEGVDAMKALFDRHEVRYT